MSRGRRLWTAIGAPILLAAASCAAVGKNDLSVKQSRFGSEALETIGAASQEVDGTIVLTLRATGADGLGGDGLMRYPPGHPQLAAIKAHVGPIPPNGSVLVRPFPDE